MLSRIAVAAGVMLMPLALLVSQPAHAEVTVRFIEAEKFVDAQDFSRHNRDDVLLALQTHLEALAPRLAGKNLSIEVTQLDLAGTVEPYGRWMEMLRVLRPITSPSIELRYVLSEGGKTLRSGQAALRDFNYLSSQNRYPSGDPIRYERRMLDLWFAEEFRAELVPAKPSP